MNLVKLLTSPAANALGWTLVHAIWQGFAVVLPTAVALYLLRSRSSALRYRLGILALAMQLLVSVATFSFYYEPVKPSISTGATQLVSAPWQQNVGVLPWHQQVLQFLEAHLSQFVVLYLIGLVVFGLRLAGGWLYLQRLSRLATPPASALWNTLINQLRATMALRPVIQIRESASIAVPVVVGIVKPVLLIPVGLATSLSVQEVEAVLAHELAHIKRQDYAVNLLQSLIDALYFFHPALWWLSAQVREERELCCDDLAVQACGGDGRRLAQALARIEELRLLQTASTPALAMAFAQQRLQLLHRVRRMLGMPTRSIVSNRSLAGLTLATILLVSASVYAVQQQQPKPKTPKAKVTPQPSKSAGGSELHFDDKRNIQYVTWKGKKLPASHVASLQRQWDQVMTGKLNLDNVRQPDRDILLSIIESDNALEKDTYSDIAASALTNIPISPDGTVKGLADVDYSAIIQDAFASLSSTKASLDTLIQPQAENLRRLSGVIADQNNQREQAKLNQGKIAILKAQAEQQRFAAEAAKRQMAVIDAQRFRLEQQRMTKAMEQQRIIMQTRVAQTDSAQAALSRQIEESERAIQKAEAEIEKANQRLIEKQKAIEDAMKPVRETEAELRKLGYSDWKHHLGRGSFTVEGFTAPEPPTSVYSVINGETVRLPKPPVPPAPLRGKPQSIKGNIIKAPKPPVPPKALTIEPAEPVPVPEVAPAPVPKPAAKNKGNNVFSTLHK